MKTNPNDPLYKKQISAWDGKELYSGLTKREYFAAMAMQSLSILSANSSNETVAGLAVEQADALINELNKEKP